MVRSFGVAAIATIGVLLVAGGGGYALHRHSQAVAADSAAERDFAIRDLPAASAAYSHALRLWPLAGARAGLARTQAWSVLAAVGVGMAYHDAWAPWIGQILSGNAGGPSNWSKDLPAMAGAMHIGEALVSVPKAPDKALATLQTLTVGDLQQLATIAGDVEQAALPYGTPSSGAQAVRLLSAEHKSTAALLTELSAVAAPYGLTVTDLTTDGLPVGPSPSLPAGWVSPKDEPHPVGWVQDTQAQGVFATVSYGPTKSMAASTSAPISMFGSGCAGCMGWTYSYTTPIDPARHLTMSMAHRFTEYLGPHVLVQCWVDTHGQVEVYAELLDPRLFTGPADYTCVVASPITEADCMQAADYLAAQYAAQIAKGQS